MVPLSPPTSAELMDLDDDISSLPPCLSLLDTHAGYSTLSSSGAPGILSISPPTSVHPFALPLDFEEDLSSDLASLAIDWKPINPDFQLHFESPFRDPDGYRNENEKPYHPLFPCPNPPMRCIKTIDDSQHPELPSSSQIPQENKEKPIKRYHPYHKPKPNPNPKEKKRRVIVLRTTRNPEDRSKYLDPGLPTNTFWKFVEERNAARARERQEAWRISCSEYGSRAGSTWDGVSERDDIWSDHPDEEGGGRNGLSFRLGGRIIPEARKLPSGVTESLAGVELIDVHDDTSVQGSSKRYMMTPNKTFLKRLMWSTQQYNEDKRKVEEARMKRDYK